ncbi:hypothetical protein [Herbidospora mongoliensis]|uniref:hypothetical protein n=1 Tax=Herbidospora mongoliensis TaxID=688067 RepID=UPI0012FA6923|nr:hypothetical protein [Herbidospora mongoliensis]
MRKTLIALGLAASVVAAQAPAGATTGIHWGPVESTNGRAAADVWITPFKAETFVVYGKLRDRAPAHCAYIRARFHYTGGGTGWSRAKTTCSTASFKLSSDGRIKRADVKVCLSKGRTTSRCYTEKITPEIIAGWPQ